MIKIDFNKIFSNLKNWHIFAILFLLGWMAYANVVNGDFIWDDKALILVNEHIRSFKFFPEWFTQSNLEGAGITTSNLYRPITTFFFASVYAIFGAEESAYHTLNIMLHITNAFLVYIFLLKLNFKKIGSLMAAIVFLLHPVQTESVSYIAGLPDLLSPFFILLGLNMLVDDKKTPDKVSTLLVIFFAVLGILSKETGIIFAPLAMLAVWYKWSDYAAKKKKNIIETIVAISAIALTYVILRMTVLNFTGSFNLKVHGNIYTENVSLRIYTFFAAIIEYFRLVFYPIGLFFEKPFVVYGGAHPKVQKGIILVLFFTACAIFSLYRKKHCFFTYIWFAITIALVSGIVLVSNATYKEHWLYMPLIGIVLLIPSIWESLKTKFMRQVFACCFAVVIISSTAQTISRNTEWRDFLTFFETEISYNPTSPRLRDEIGHYYFARGEYEKAAEYFIQGIELDKDKNIPHLGTALGNAYLGMKNLDAAINEYFTVLSIHPNHFDAHVALYNIAIATHNKPMEEAFLAFLKRLEAGESIDFEKEILPFATVNN